MITSHLFCHERDSNSSFLKSRMVYVAFPHPTFCSHSAHILQTHRLSGFPTQGSFIHRLRLRDSLEGEGYNNKHLNREFTGHSTLSPRSCQTNRKLEWPFTGRTCRRHCGAYVLSFTMQYVHLINSHYIVFYLQYLEYKFLGTKT